MYGIKLGFWKSQTKNTLSISCFCSNTNIRLKENEKRKCTEEGLINKSHVLRKFHWNGKDEERQKEK